MKSAREEECRRGLARRTGGEPLAEPNGISLVRPVDDPEREADRRVLHGDLELSSQRSEVREPCG